MHGASAKVRVYASPNPALALKLPAGEDAAVVP